MRRYTVEELRALRDSPLVEKPPGLPPAEEYIGYEQTQSEMYAAPLRLDSRDKNEGIQNRRGEPRGMERRESATDQGNKRPPLEKISRSTASELIYSIHRRERARLTTSLDLGDIVLGPPKTSFASARNSKTMDGDKTREPDTRDKYPFRKGDTENDRASNRYTQRPRRGDADQDNEGWSTVKPRKSFGAEGAERFTGRMGGDRHRDDAPPMPRRGSRTGDDDTRERPPRNFNNYSRDKDTIRESIEGPETPRWNGYGRGRNEPSWFKDKEDSAPPQENRKSNGEKFGGNRGWREKDTRDERPFDRTNDRNNDRGDRITDRNMDRSDREDRTKGRWTRGDDRKEREPEWMDEPIGEKKTGHTAADFQKWKESMNAGINPNLAKGSGADEKPILDTSGQDAFFGFSATKAEPQTPVEPTGDKFKSRWATAKDDDEPMSVPKRDGPLKTAPVGKASRFTSFFANPPADDSPRRNEPAPSASSVLKEAPQSEKEKEDFQKLLQKLQSQSFGLKLPSPPPNQMSQPKPPPLKQTSLPGIEQFNQFRPAMPEPQSAGLRDPQQQAAFQEMIGSRSASASQPTTRADTMGHDMMPLRQAALSQTSNRPEQDVNKNSAFLMNLMQAQARPTPDQMRAEQMMMRGPPPPQQQASRQQQQLAQQQMLEREHELMMRERQIQAQRERANMPPGFLPGFPDEQFLERGMPPMDSQGRGQRGPSAPSQILQRPPPGLDGMPPGFLRGEPQPSPAFLQQQREQAMREQRHMAPPPGLINGGRGMPPMGFPPFQGQNQGFMSPDNGPPNPRNMPPPPPGFMGGPPGFMPPPLSAGPGPGPGFPGPGMGFPPDFDGRGGPPPGVFRR